MLFGSEVHLLLKTEDFVSIAKGIFCFLQGCLLERLYPPGPALGRWLDSTVAV